jgi:hypothetical protein
MPGLNQVAFLKAPTKTLQAKNAALNTGMMTLGLAPSRSVARRIVPS